MRALPIAFFALVLAVASRACVPLRTGARVLLLLLEEFSILPVRPLRLLTPAPAQQTVWLDTPHGTVVADLFVPRRRLLRGPAKRRPAIICAMGVRTEEKDKPLIYHLAETLARLDYTVLWPRSAQLDSGVPAFEEPETFVAAFTYLTSLTNVDPTRISFVGFSVGSSIALVAAEDPRIADRVHGLLFFGGYYEAGAYLISLATRTATVGTTTVPWQPHHGATGHLREILAQAQADGLLRVLDAATQAEAQALLARLPPDERAIVARLDPSAGIDRLRARVFILHDRSDPYVPYGEALKLARALEARGGATLLLVDLFEHVQPRRRLTRPLVGELVKLYAFLVAVMGAFERPPRTAE